MATKDYFACTWRPAPGSLVLPCDSRSHEPVEWISIMLQDKTTPLIEACPLVCIRSDSSTFLHPDHGPVYVFGLHSWQVLSPGKQVEG